MNTPVDTKYDPDAVIGEWGWLWMVEELGQGEWVLVATFTDDDDGSTRVTGWSLDDPFGDTSPEYRAEDWRGEPYIPLSRPACAPARNRESRPGYGQHPRKGRLAAPLQDRNRVGRNWRHSHCHAARMAGAGQGADLMKLKAELGAYSSVLGNSVHLIGENGRMVGQIAILCHDDALRDKDVQTELSQIICDAINASEGGKS